MSFDIHLVVWHELPWLQLALNFSNPNNCLITFLNNQITKSLMTPDRANKVDKPLPLLLALEELFEYPLFDVLLHCHDAF